MYVCSFENYIVSQFALSLFLSLSRMHTLEIVEIFANPSVYFYLLKWIGDWDVVWSVWNEEHEKGQT